VLPLLGLPDGEDHFIGLEGFLKIVVGALAHGGERGVFIAEGAHHDDQGSATLGAEFSEKAEAVHAGHLNVAEDQLELLRSGARERPIGVALYLDPVAGLAEQQRERLPETRVVVNDQQPHRSHPRLEEKP
jgi:sugar/nucleoside kinase (ribokinase family)